MESFGKLLRETRERKNLSLEETADGTSISEQYILALESENIKTFPGEPYAAGFLRNYSEFLGLDSAYMISLLRARLIQEQDPPPELLARHRPAYLIPLIIFIALVFFGGTGFLLWHKLHPPKESPPDDTISGAGGATYELSTASFNGRLFPSDKLVVPYPGGDITLTVTETLGSLALQTPVGVQFVELGEERELDIDGITGSEIIVFVSDVSKSNMSRGAEVRVVMKNNMIEQMPADDAGRKDNFSFVIEGRRNPFPFMVNVSFRGACLLRYQSDRNETHEEYYHTGTGDETITVPPDARTPTNNGIRFWVSNNSVIGMQVVAGGEKHDINITRLGLGKVVAVFDIKWMIGGNGLYHLVVQEID
jgi:cytoskeletal protein RodZ